MVNFYIYLGGYFILFFIMAMVGNILEKIEEIKWLLSLMMLNLWLDVSISCEKF